MGEHFRGSLLLEFNRKTQISPVKNGVNYLGWHFYLTPTGKIVRKLKTGGKRRIKRRFGRIKKDYANGVITFADAGRSLVSTHGHLVHGHTYRLRKKLWERLVFRRK